MSREKGRFFEKNGPVARRSGLAIPYGEALVACVFYARCTDFFWGAKRARAETTGARGYIEGWRSGGGLPGVLDGFEIAFAVFDSSILGSASGHTLRSDSREIV